MVLIRSGLLVFALAGCGQSLFDSRGDTDGGTGGDGGDGDAPAALTCPTPCIADVAADFDGTPGGTGNRWRYLDDRRNRTWVPMTPDAGSMVGADPNNKISTCAMQPGAAGCAALPGALLISSAGMQSMADPAIELTVAADEVIQVTLRVHVPVGAPAQIIRIYRNSREDVLATALAMTGVTLDRTIPIDALAGDRLLVAIAPAGVGAADVALHLFVNATGAVFPSNCQLALSFSAVSTANVNAIDDRCGTADAAFRNWTANMEIPPQLAAGPFPEQGMAADIPSDLYYLGVGTVPRTGDTTTQMWVRHDAFVDGNSAWIFSDEDLDAGGGLGIGIYDNAGVRMLEAVTCTDPGNPLMFARTSGVWPATGGWHFIRVTHTNGMVALCLDGKRVGSFAAPTGSLRTTYAPRFGRNSFGLPTGAWFDGGLDDIRLFNTALPCE